VIHYADYADGISGAGDKRVGLISLEQCRGDPVVQIRRHPALSRATSSLAVPHPDSVRTVQLALAQLRTLHHLMLD
jgi:hypothetical protein